MKKLFDYLPVVVFFVVYFATGRDIYPATWGILVASAVQIVAGWLVWRKVERLHLLVFAITLVFGGLTLVLHDDVFIKWRPTVIYGVLATVLLGGLLLRERSLLQRLSERMMISSLGRVVPLTSGDWRWLNCALIGYFSLLAFLNIYVAYRFSTDFWVNFKLIGFTVLNFGFYIGLFAWIYKRLPADERARLFEERRPPQS
ncbi:inner membrane-spanning protein YciB [Isoalcanivorax beigongshangi]|uniref:Inner membrane-spanning protein YciB n=1 Tax=Isoalcanivorax beigongshangi TaxID=3238810 RepID=A0ABV4AHS3_9GAMM